MTLNATSLAAGVGASAKNVQFTPEALNVPRKILIVGTYDSTKQIIDDVPVQILSPSEAGSIFGFGSMIHRLSIQVFKGSSGVETWVVPQKDVGSAIAATGYVDFQDSSGVRAGTITFYVAGESVSFAVSDNDTPAKIARKLAVGISTNRNLPVIATINSTQISRVGLTSKAMGSYGNEITLKFNIKFGDEIPAGVVVSVVDMNGGAGIPDITTALNCTGIGDDANERFFTDGIHGYGIDSTTLDKISNWIGLGNQAIGLYDKLVSRPMRWLTGDTTEGSTGFTNIKELGNSRKLDRANGVIAAPGSASHPSEIAAQAIGIMARVNGDRAAQHYIGMPLSGKGREFN